MNLYRHYKNKPYCHRGIARHSETLEELVVYETLYENEGGALWVRPKAMFEATVTIEGVEQPRFAKIESELESVTRIRETHREAVMTIGSQGFSSWDPSAFDKRLEAASSALLILARIDGEPAGFKIGYARDAGTFYSWLGCVRTDLRRIGIAADLMEHQHAWARAAGYATIATKCLNDNLAMLNLNLRSGFRVVGTEPVPEGLKLLLEKKLA